MNRRTFLSGAVAAGLALPAVAHATERVRLTLPKPTGRHPIGRVSRHLVDHARQDPWWETPHPRELMVDIWYPARTGNGRCTPWMTPGALATYRPAEEDRLTDMAQRLGLGDVEISLAGVDYPVTHAREGAPREEGDWPVVLYSPGYQADRETGTVLVEDLASRGYVVVTIGHTYDATEVEFPGSRVELGRPGLDTDGHLQVAIRRADTRFVLDQLNLTRVGMFGHSLGGATTGQSMVADSRVVAGLDLDGHVIPDVPFGPDSGRTPEEVQALLAAVAAGIGDRPFVVMSSDGHGPDQLGPLMTGFWYHLTGWRRFLSLTGTTHGSYTDIEALYPQLSAAGVLPAALVSSIMGATPGDRVIAAQRAYVGAFFDRWLRGRDNHLLDGPSAEYPEVSFF